MTEKNLITPCGLDCSKCDMYTNYNGKDPRKAKFIIYPLYPLFAFKSLFSKNSRIKFQLLKRMMKINLSHPICKGCREECGKIPVLGMKSTCQIYRCADKKGIHNCSECNDFPCYDILPRAYCSTLIPHNTKIANLCMIKKYGIEQWNEKHYLQIMKTYFKSKLPFEM